MIDTTNTTIHYTRKRTSSVTRDEQWALAAFAIQRYGSLHPDYVHSRFSLYEEIIVASSGSCIHAFAYVQSFTHDDGIYLYIGPVFSEGGLFTYMIGWWFQLRLPLHGLKVHVMAEVQNSKLLQWLDPMLCQYSRGMDTPTVTHQVLQVFANKLPPITGIDSDRMTSLSTEALHAAKRNTIILTTLDCTQLRELTTRLKTPIHPRFHQHCSHRELSRGVHE